MKLALRKIIKICTQTNDICTQIKEFGIQWIYHFKQNKLSLKILEIITQKNEFGTQNVKNVTQLFLTMGKKVKVIRN